MKKVLLLLCVLSVALIVPGCHQPVTVSYEKLPAVDTQRDQMVDQLQAKLTDVPFPFTSQKIRLISDISLLPHSCTFSCQTFLSHDELIAFYHAEMERMGWQELSFVHADDQSIAVFQKPTRSAAVLIEKVDSGCSVRLFVQAQELVV